MQILSHGLNEMEYSVYGKGFPVVFLHGYFETIEIWNDYKDKLQKSCQLIIPNLNIVIQGGTNTPSDYSRLLNQIFLKLKLDKWLMVGHSMGGYVALDFAKCYPDRVAGLILSNTILEADTPNKRKRRHREIKLIKDGYKSKIISLGFSNAFSRKFKMDYSSKFKHHLRLAAQISDEVICFQIQLMTERNSHLNSLNHFKGWVMAIYGKDDPYIPQGLLLNYLKTNNDKIHIISKIGHMLPVEQPSLLVAQVQKSLKILA
jgi:pimeloyl-ACP methyl ester carboxylesterase